MNGKISNAKYRFVIWLLLSLLFGKFLVAILNEYHFYFPADFENSSFLIGRDEHFKGLYWIAFYSHILAGPITLVGAFFLMMTGGIKRFRFWHRTVGKIALGLVLAIIVPSGLVMSTQSLTGPIAGVGFALTAIFTGISAMFAIWYARQKRFTLHKIWATRCFIFLCSPILLRLISSAAFVTSTESDLSYQLSAWLSWLVPLAFYEVARHIPKQKLDQELMG